MYEIINRLKVHNTKFNVDNYIFEVRLNSAEFDLSHIIRDIFDKYIANLMISIKSRVGFTINFMEKSSFPLHIEYSDLNNVFRKIETINLRLTNINQSKSLDNLKNFKLKVSLIKIKG